MRISAPTRHALGLAAALVLATLVHEPAAAQSTAFTYQGSLESGGAPTSGLHDFRFRLYDAASGGAQVGLTLCVDNVSVVGGVFNVQLDFGQQFATTAPRHLEIEVRRDTGLNCSNIAGFTYLAPRQPITAAPIAMHAHAAFALDAADGSPTNAVVVDNSGNVGVGTTAPIAKLDVRGGPIMVENLGDQADLLTLASERSWVFRQEGTGATAALKLQSIGGGGNKNFVVQTDGLMGIGTTLPQAKLDVRGDIKLGSSGQYFALGGQENLRILRGDVLGNGTINHGAGFSVSRTSAGVYDITFSPAFSGVPTVMATTHYTGSAAARWAFTPGPTAGTVRIITWTTEGTGFTDTDFSILVIGPR